MSNSRSNSPTTVPPSTPKTKPSAEHASTDPPHSENLLPLARSTPGPSHPPPRLDQHALLPTTRRRRRVTEEETSEEPMAKRLRTRSPSHSHSLKNQSSPESDSQDDNADTEFEGKALEASDQAPPPPPPKKKRTRTLTTPHQSAVLHALLAQSRFPTTAMREEVGKSIGLSARKVQIWFQNQRQKARRPRNQSDSNRTPQYGPFQAVAEPSSSIHRFQNYGPPRPQFPGHSPPETSSGASELPLRLLGPGMPGAPATYAPPGYRSVLPAPSDSPAGPTPFPFSSTGGSRSFRAMHPNTRLSRSPQDSWRERERDPSRILPPLLPTRPSESNTLPSFWGDSDVSQRRTPIPYRSLSPEQRFGLRHSPEPVSRAALHLPPPFTLQPAPQWDENVYPPRTSSWPRIQATRPRSMSPMPPRRNSVGSPHRGGRSNTRERGLSPSPSDSRAGHSRSGRYDPIRSTYIPYYPNPSTPPLSHEYRPRDGGQSDRDNRPHSRSH